MVDRIQKLMVLTAALVGGLIASERVADAAMVAGMSGRLEVPDTSTQNCVRALEAGSGSAKGVCSPGVFWTVPVPITNSGTKNVIVAMSTDTATFCLVKTFNQLGQISQSATLVFNSSNILGTVVTVPTSGTLVVRCTLMANTVLHSINYDP